MKNGSEAYPPFQEVWEISHVRQQDLHKVKFGRANKKGEARFYCSNEIRTACIEAITSGFTAKTGNDRKHVTVGSWKIVEPLMLAEINFSEKTLQDFLKYDVEVGRYNEMIQHCRRWKEHTLKMIGENDNYSREFNETILDFFSGQFSNFKIDGDYDYFLSNYYSDHIFERCFESENLKSIDGIIYPSVAFSCQEYNIVLHPRAMKKIKFISAMNVWIVYWDKDQEIEFNILEQGASSNEYGELQWKNFNTRHSKSPNVNLKGMKL